TYAYDLADRLVAETHPGGLRTTYEYDVRDRLTRIRTADASDNVVWEQSADYDAAGNVVRLTEPRRSVSYTYDAAARVQSEVRAGDDAGTLDYARDADWNPTLMAGRSIAYDGAQRLISDGVFTSYVYDDAGRPIQRANAQVTERFEYDSLGRLIRLDRAGA